VDPRTINAFLALIVVQAAHSFEEWFFGLYDVFAPAHFVGGLVSTNISMGFAILNVVLIGFGAWCYVRRVRPGCESAYGWIWLWIFIEFGNGVVHTTMAVVRVGYFPGVVTAPFLFALALYLATRLLRTRRT
jgi:hypothetical protein